MFCCVKLSIDFDKLKFSKRKTFTFLFTCHFHCVNLMETICVLLFLSLAESLKTRQNRKTTNLVDVSTANSIHCPAVPSPSLIDEPDDDRLSISAASNDSSATNRSINGVSSSLVNGNKQTNSNILTTPTSEGLAITATNPTGQKQIFMAKQLGNLKKYQCGLCEKIVTNIQIHVRRHTNDKPYPWYA